MKLHSTALFGFFVGGLAGYFAFKVRGGDCCVIARVYRSCVDGYIGRVSGFRRTHHTPHAHGHARIHHYQKRQKFEHAALLINISVTTMCALIHTLYGTFLCTHTRARTQGVPFQLPRPCRAVDTPPQQRPSLPWASTNPWAVCRRAHLPNAPDNPTCASISSIPHNTPQHNATQPKHSGLPRAHVGRQGPRVPQRVRNPYN